MRAMLKLELKRILKKIKQYDVIVIVRHISPDPDAIASQISLRDAIKLTFPKKEVYAVGTSVSKFKYYGNLDRIDETNFTQDALLIACDVPNASRIDGVDKSAFKEIFKIDHHPSDEVFGECDWVDETSSSTCQMIIELLLETGMKFDRKIAENLFMGVVSDSDRFLISYTTSKTFKLIAELIDKSQIDFTKLYSNLYERPYSEIKFHGYLSDNLNITENGFDYCVNNNIDWVYLHTFGEEQKTLVGLCEEYGFSLLGKYKQDDVYIKPMKLQDDGRSTLDSLIKYYPYFKEDTEVSKFIIPIQPKYHEDLFPDFSNMKGSLFEKDQNLYSCQGNTIKKAYLSHSKIQTINKGDIVLFYRSHDRKSIQCMGIVESVFFSDNVDDVFSRIAKRTVYSYDELREITNKKTLVILFRFISLNREISNKDIKDAGIKGNIQSIRKITNDQYLLIKNGK